MIYIEDNSYDGTITKPDLDEAIEHYGVLGMRWGVRKDRTSSGRLGSKTRKKLRKGIDVSSSRGKVRRRLNNLEKAKTDFLSDIAAERIKELKNNSKSEKYKQKGKYEKAEKYKEKAKKAKSFVKENERYVRDLDSAIKDVKKIGSKNYNISSKKVYQTTHRNPAGMIGAIGGVAGGAIGALASTAGAAAGVGIADAYSRKKYKKINGNNTPYTVQIDKYKVKRRN